MLGKGGGVPAGPPFTFFLLLLFGSGAAFWVFGGAFLKFAGARRATVEAEFPSSSAAKAFSWSVRGVLVLAVFFVFVLVGFVIAFSFSLFSFL
jgi:hypothetical protein